MKQNEIILGGCHPAENWNEELYRERKFKEALDRRRMELLQRGDLQTEPAGIFIKEAADNRKGELPTGMYK